MFHSLLFLPGARETEKHGEKFLPLVAFQMCDFSFCVNLLYYKTIIFDDCRLTNRWGQHIFLMVAGIILTRFAVQKNH